MDDGSHLLFPPLLLSLCSDVKVKKGAELTKFKLRLSRYLYTLKVADAAKAEKIAQSFPPGLKKEDIKGKNTAAKPQTAA